MTDALWALLGKATIDTLIMVVASTALAVLVGVPLGVALILTAVDGLTPSPVVNRGLGAVVNIGRSLPFIILLVLVAPLTRTVTGTTIGPIAAIVPLTLAAIPFLARLVETALREVDGGKVDAAVAMGATTGQIVRVVYLPEALPALVSGVTVTFVSLIGYSAMAGAIGGGGLGDVAIRYGYQRYNLTVTLVTVVLLLALTQLVQLVGDRLAPSTTADAHSPQTPHLSPTPSGTARVPAYPKASPPMRPLTTIAVTVAAATLALTGCSSAQTPAQSDPNAAIKVGVSPVPHGEILAAVIEDQAAAAGLKVEAVEFNDYVQPNEALQSGAVDANYFQHKPYLEEQSRSRGYDFVALKAVHLEPLGLYSQKVRSVNALRDGASVGIPNDPSNGGRALKLLAAKGLITLKSTGDAAPTVIDIEKNDHHLQIKEVEAAQLPRSLADLDAAVINGNYAIGARLSPKKDAIALEDAKDNPYANILVVKKGRENDERLTKLADLLCSPATKALIEKKYDGAIVPAC